MEHPFFFGYGSLVNRGTHDYPHAVRATVSGYRRSWRGTTLRRVAFLTAIEAPGAQIDGLIAAVPGEDWAALDERERAYWRSPVEDIRHEHAANLSVEIYQVEAQHVAADGDHPILLSYLDTVVQGFLREYGEAGALRFFETTDGWAHAVVDDRAAPIYTRAQDLTPWERSLVDGALVDLGVERIYE